VSAFSEHVLVKGERLFINCTFIILLFKVGDVRDSHFVLRAYITEKARHVLFGNY
jgi:hypothetical protein